LLEMGGVEERIQRIKMLIIDVDGVMTDGGIILGSGSIELKRFHVHDGMGITLAKAAGLMVGILTSRDSEVVKKRANELGIDEVQQGFFHKEEGYRAILEKHGLRDEEVAYIGDDILDIPVLRRAGFSICVADGADEAKQVSHYVTQKKGGEGAVREVVEMFLNGLGKKEETIVSLIGPSKNGAQK
jgi:3-deoxy-D-manno-octulosonate 8-phosphate phosphatase (KDO 8-P phosphatase)